jgi:proline dehydrogenase
VTVQVVVDEYRRILDRIAAEQLDARIALKLTHLGLNLSEELAFRNLARLLDHAAELGNFIRIDMEESARVDATLRIYRRLLAEGHENVGTVLQSYLHRTEADLESLLPLKPNLRLVKGAYLESPDIAFPEKADVDRNYIRLAERMLTEASYTAIATHDERIIDHVIGFTERQGIGRDRFEFQMLYGIRPQFQLDLVRRGYRVLVATPFGPEWYYYLMRRLAERPANVLFLLRNLVHS